MAMRMLPSIFTSNYCEAMIDFTSRYFDVY